MKPTWRALATIFMLCVLTVMAIAVSISAVLGAIGQMWLAAGVVIVAFVQLCFGITIWRRAHTWAEAHGPDATHASGSDSPAADSQHGAGGGPTASGDTPHVSDTAPYASRDSANEPDGRAAGAVITGVDILDQGQLDLHLEPLVELTEMRTVYYRASLALKRPDGSRMGPYLLSLSANRGGFEPALDLALFRRVCPVIRHLQARSRRPGVFCPLAPQSFARADVLDELIQLIKANPGAGGGTVIEISQPALAALSPAGMEGLAYLAELGQTLSMSEARLDGPDLATLKLLGFRFIDLDIAALASAHGWDAFDEDGAVWRLSRRAEQAGLTVIAAHVARSEELEHVRPLSRLARGSLFSPPRLVRREIMEIPAQAAAA